MKVGIDRSERSDHTRGTTSRSQRERIVELRRHHRSQLCTTDRRVLYDNLRSHASSHNFTLCRCPYGSTDRAVVLPLR